jgi:hypothetical protein
MSGDAQRRLILHMAVSLDGFVARSDGVIDWLSTPRPGGVDPGDHRHHANLEMLGQIGLVVLGRRAYEEMAPAWSSSDSPTARILNALPKIVFAREHSPIVVGIRRAQHRANPRAKRGLIGLGLTHEVAQRALPNHGVQGAAHGLVGVLNGRLREREENPFLAAHPLEIGDQLALQSTIATRTSAWSINASVNAMPVAPAHHQIVRSRRVRHRSTKHRGGTYSPRHANSRANLRSTLR